MVERRFESRFADSMKALGVGTEPLTLLVAYSGGLDSTVLLHLLRFGPLWGSHSIAAAHFDHAMRETSAADAAWVSGLCRAWGVPLGSTRASTRIFGEQAAREERYRFLRAHAGTIRADWVLTAHHADDQAETVLFRVLRGTGIAGLRGIPARGPDLLRPLLSFWREELEDYARDHGVRWREDPTNTDLGPTRNRLRASILPELERTIAPGARRSLISLAMLARENEDGWNAVVESLLAEVVTRADHGYTVDRAALRDAGPAAGARVVRELLRRLGVVPDRAGTRSALQFITDAASGREIALPLGVRISTEFGQAVIRRDIEARTESSLTLDRVTPGSAFAGTITLGRRTYRVTLAAAQETEVAVGQRPGWTTWLPSGTPFPICLRGRAPGDRVRIRGRSRSLKRLMIDRRIPRGERSSIPVVVDADGSILWVAGFAIDRPVASDMDGLLIEVVPVE